VKPGLWLALLGWPALAMAWEEEPAIGGGGHFGPGVPVPGGRRIEHERSRRGQTQHKVATIC